MKTDQDYQELAKLKILLICYIFPPSGGGGVFRPTKFIKHASRLGAKIHVLTVDSKFYCRAQDVVDENLLHEVNKAAQVIRTSRIPLSLSELRAIFSQGGNQKEKISNSQPRAADPEGLGILRKAGAFFSFPDQEVGWMPFAIYHGLKLIKSAGIEVIYATGPPHSSLVVGKILAQLSGRPLVIEFRDPWALFPEKAGGRSFEAASRRRQWEGALETQVIKRAERVIVVNKAVASLYEKAYPALQDGKVAVIPNGYDPEGFLDQSNGRSPDPDKFIITFAGSFYGDHGPSAFVQGLEKFLAANRASRRNLEFQVVGSMDRQAKAELRHFEQWGLVRYLGHITHAKSVTMLQNSTLLLLVLPESPVTDCWVPAKTYEYLATDRPILAVIPDGELRRILSHFQGVRIVDPSDQDGIVDALSQEYELWSSGIFEPVKRDDSKIQTRSDMAEQILKIIKEAQGG